MSSTSVPFGLHEIFVVDSWPLVAIAKGRLLPRMAALLDAAERGEVTLLLSEMNLGELFYLMVKEHSVRRAELALEYIQKSLCRVVPLAAGDAMKAARFKAFHKVSYADSITATLAIESRARVLTGDPDFLKLQDLGVVEVEWVGA